MTRAFGAPVVLVVLARGAAAAAPLAGAGGAPGTPTIESSAAAAGRGTEQSKYVWKPLRSAEATATSYLQNNWNKYEENYHPSYVLDENPATAWVEGAEGFGENEAITIPLSTVRRARAVRLRIWNGYQKSMHLWTKNAMPQRVRITVLDGDEDEVVSTERELTRTLGPQEVVVDLPRRRGLAAIRLTILSVYKGEKFDDTCISDILVDVDSKVAYNPAAENAKHETLLKWVAGRKETAQYFASKPVEFPFAASRYLPKRSRGDREPFKQRLAARDQIAKTLAPERYKVVAKQSVRKMPDGLADLDLHADEFAQLLRADRLALLETKDEVVAHTEEGTVQSFTSASRVTRGADGKSVRTVAFEVREVVTERSTSTEKRQMLLVYDDRGQLATIYRTVEGFAESGGEDDPDTTTHTDEIWSLSYDASGKVDSVQVESLSRHQNSYGKKVGREREDKWVRSVHYAGMPDKSS